MPRGWPKQPARHALAAQGIKTTRGPPLGPAIRALGETVRQDYSPAERDREAEFDRKIEKRFNLPAETLKEIYFEVEIAAYDEGGGPDNQDRKGALALIHDPKWFEAISGDLARMYGKTEDDQKRITDFLYTMYHVRKVAR
mgnify:CR=1 FL=1